MNQNSCFKPQVEIQALFNPLNFHPLTHSVKLIIQPIIGTKFQARPSSSQTMLSNQDHAKIHQNQLPKTQVGPHNYTKPQKHENRSTQPHQISQTCRIANYPRMLLHQTPQVRKESIPHTLMPEEIFATIFIFTKGFHFNRDNRTNMQVIQICIRLWTTRISTIQSTSLLPQCLANNLCI